MICREAFDLRIIGALLFVAGMAISVLLLMAYFYFADPSDTCSVCGHEFKDPPAEFPLPCLLPERLLRSRQGATRWPILTSWKARSWRRPLPWK